MAMLRNTIMCIGICIWNGRIHIRPKDMLSFSVTKTRPEKFILYRLISLVNVVLVYIHICNGIRDDVKNPSFRCKSFYEWVFHLASDWDSSLMAENEANECLACRYKSTINFEWSQMTLIHIYALHWMCILCTHRHRMRRTLSNSKVEHRILCGCACVCWPQNLFMFIGSVWRLACQRQVYFSMHFVTRVKVYLYENEIEMETGL